jgi:hypothetical protein
VIITGTDIRKTVETELRADLPARLTALGVSKGLTLPAPKTWRRLHDFLRMTEQQSPAVVVTSPGLDGPPNVTGPDEWEADWLVRVYCVVRGRTYDETADRVGHYVGALRAALLDNAGLAALASGIEWRAESYAELATDEQRSIGAGSVTVAYLGIPTDLDLPSVPVTAVFDPTTTLLPADL